MDLNLSLSELSGTLGARSMLQMTKIDIATLQRVYDQT